MSNIDEIFTKEELEEIKKENMRELLIEAFDGSSVLFEIYKKRGWLENLFTDKILSMEKDASYTTKQVAEICETQDYNIKNKRRELIDYINPTPVGGENSKVYKHNYISVFKLKMIDGLTKDGSEYTLPHLKSLLYPGLTTRDSSNKNTEPTNELLMTILKKLERFEKFEQMITSGEFINQVELTAKEAANSLLLNKGEEDKVKERVLEEYSKISSADTNISDKEKAIEVLREMELEHPDQAYTIRMYINAAEERLAKIMQDQRELHIRKIKEDLSVLFEEFPNADGDRREEIMDRLNRLGKENPDLNYEIRYWISMLGKQQQKKGFFSRLFNK